MAWHGVDFLCLCRSCCSSGIISLSSMFLLLSVLVCLRSAAHGGSVCSGLVLAVSLGLRTRSGMW